MTQFTFGTIDANTKSGTQLATDLNNFRDALYSSHKGATRPTYAEPGTIWVAEVSSTRWDINFYDGDNDMLLRSFNPATNTFYPLAVAAGGTGGADQAAAQAALGVLASSKAVAKDSATGAASMPVGTTVQRPVTPGVGMFRYNTTLLRFEGYAEGVWGELGGGGGGGGSTSTLAIASGVLDLSLASTETVLVSLNQNITSITLPAGASGKRKDLVVQFTQDATGGRTVAGWPTSPTTLQWQGGVPPTVSSSPGAMTQISMSNADNSAWIGYANMNGGCSGALIRLPATQRFPIMCSGGTAHVAQAVTASRTYFIPFIPNRRIKLRALGINVTTLLAGAGTLGIYAADGDLTMDYPGTLLASCAPGSINTATSGTKEGFLDYVLEPGVLYFMAFVHSTAVQLRSIPVAAQLPTLGFTDNAATVTSCYYVASPTNLLPSPGPGSGVTALIATSIPAIYLIE
jgi:hypothetical protein